MKRYGRARPPLVLFALALLAGAGVPAVRADLARDIDAVLGDRLLRRAVVGIDVVRLGANPSDARTVFSRRADETFIPASNLKLVTTSAALERLGANYKFRTVLLAGPDGDLALVGSGDPSLGDAEFLKKVGWDVTTVFESWADQLQRRNTLRFRNLLVDDGVFDEEFAHPNWPRDQLHKRYEAGVGGLNLNANCLDFTVRPSGPGRVVGFSLSPDTRYATVRNTCVGGGENAVWLSREPGGNEIILRGQTRGRAAVAASVTLHDPPMFAGTVLAETLAKKGITLTGSVRRDRTVTARREGEAGADGGTGWKVVAIHETPLPTILARVNKDSMNLYAECLLKRLGHDAANAPGSWANGTAAVGEYLREIGIEENQFRLDDGCGLSKENLVSPSVLTRVLTRDFYGRNREVFLASLAVGGVDGTLEDRFTGMDLKGRVLGKSGYVNGVRCLSGFLKTTAGEWYAFSILMNKTPDHPAVKSLQDKIVRAIDANATAVADGGE